MTIPGYDREPVTAEDWQEYRKEAERRGHVYELFIDDWEYTGDSNEGEKFRADSLDEAKSSAYWRAWAKSCKMDGKTTITGAHYPTHGYRLFYQGNLIVDYKPPCPEDVASGKVNMPVAREVNRAGFDASVLLVEPNHPDNKLIPQYHTDLATRVTNLEREVKVGFAEIKRKLDNR